MDDHFAGKDPLVRQVYERVLSAVRRFGPVREEAKKTSIHLARSSALAGVQVRKGYLLLTIKADHLIQSPRIQKHEQISADRIYHVVKLMSPDDVDKELRQWLEAAYALSD